MDEHLRHSWTGVAPRAIIDRTSRLRRSPTVSEATAVSLTMTHGRVETPLISWIYYCVLGLGRFSFGPEFTHCLLENLPCFDGAQIRIVGNAGCFIIDNCSETDFQSFSFWRNSFNVSSSCFFNLDRSEIPNLLYNFRD